MGQRTVRVNILIREELSKIIHTDYQQEAVAVTLTDVDIAPDLRQARVFYSVVGGVQYERSAARFFKKNARDLKQKLTKRIVLKYTPHLTFVLDRGIERGTKLMDIFDEIDRKENQ